MFYNAQVAGGLHPHHLLALLTLYLTKPSDTQQISFHKVTALDAVILQHGLLAVRVIMLWKEGPALELWRVWKVGGQ